ncbi:MAG: ribonuclease III [Clostridia bacterium]|nr:ribonuclease III [Clostridia bacterium]
MTRKAERQDYPRSFLEKCGELEEKIGHRFQREDLLLAALTHSSFANEKKGRIHYPHNERLEFLGDAVLSAVVSEHIFADEHSFPEGVLTRLRAASVNAEALFEYASALDLGAYMLLNHGLEETGGRRQKNVLADCFEALIAALFLDGGMETASPFILRYAVPKLQELLSGGKLHDRDYKSVLQEKVQTSPGEKLEYRTVEESGPDHDKRFRVALYLNSNLIGEGDGRSKREAEQAAARQALTEWFGASDET